MDNLVKGPCSSYLGSPVSVTFFFFFFLFFDVQLILERDTIRKCSASRLVTKLARTFQDSSFLYFLMEFNAVSRRSTISVFVSFSCFILFPVYFPLSTCIGESSFLFMIVSFALCLFLSSLLTLVYLLRSLTPFLVPPKQLLALLLFLYQREDVRLRCALALPRKSHHSRLEPIRHCREVISWSPWSSAGRLRVQCRWQESCSTQRVLRVPWCTCTVVESYTEM